MYSSRVVVGIGIASMLAGCGGGASPGGSGKNGPGTVTTGVNVSALYIANSDDTTVARLDLDTNLVKQFTVGNEPSRIARSGTRMFVTLRTERAVAVFEASSGDLESVGRIATGAEPYGIAANDTRVYVASSVGGFVAEYDAATFAELRRWTLPGEPKWVALHPSNKALFVGSTYGGHVFRIGIEKGESAELSLPQSIGFSNPGPNGPVALTPRVTGDLVVSPDGAHVYVPMLLVDNTTTIPDATGNASTGPGIGCGMQGPPPSPPSNGGGAPAGSGAPSGSGSSGSGSSSGGMGPVDPPVAGGVGCGGGYDSQKFNPVVLSMGTNANDGTMNTGEASEMIAVRGFVNPISNGRGSSNVFSSPGEINGYPSSLQITADSKVLLATIEGAGAIIAISTEPPMGQGGIIQGGPGQGITFRQTFTIATGSGPRGIAIVSEDKAYVHTFFDHTIEEFDLGGIRDIISKSNSGNNANIPAPIPFPMNGGNVQWQQPTSKVFAIVTAASLDPAAEEGRKLFFAANDPVMASVGAGVSCATCHFDGRTDGLTWSFVRGQRQTPMLAANLKDAFPVGWAGNVPTVADEGFNTSQKLMGGHGISKEQTAAIQAFLLGERTVDTPMKNQADDAGVQRGAAVFAQIGCASCHNGPSHTNNQVYSMMGLDQVKTRPLASIAASAPYFHDGRAKTLSDVIDYASQGNMGDPFTISAAEKADLILFLESL